MKRGVDDSPGLGSWLGLEACWVSHVLISGHRWHNRKLPYPLENLGAEGSPSSLVAARLFRRPLFCPGRGRRLYGGFSPVGRPRQLSPGAWPGRQTLSFPSATQEVVGRSWSLGGQARLLPIPVQELSPDPGSVGRAEGGHRGCCTHGIKMTSESRLHIPTRVSTAPL